MPPALAPALPESLRHSRPVQVLEASLARGRLAHGILLEADHIEPLRTVARALASVLLRVPAPEALEHPDCFLLGPSGKSRQIKVGENAEEPNTMRRLLRDLQQSSLLGGHKVGLVLEADRMNANASNAFLKTLEEPPRETTLLLLTTRPYDLLPTIRSRCFHFRLPAGIGAARDPRLDAWLQDYIGWVRHLIRGTSSGRERCEVIFAAYGLIHRLTQIIAAKAEESVEAQEKTLAAMEDDEREAQEVGIRRGVRRECLRELEFATRRAAHEASHETPFKSVALAQVIEELERATGLLEVNLKEEAALESFFLRSLRLWRN